MPEKVKSPPYEPFKFQDQEKHISKSVFEIQSDLRMRNLHKIDPFSHNQNSTFARSTYLPQKSIQGESIVKKIGKVEIKKLKGTSDQASAREKNLDNTKFSCRSCILIVISLLILAIMGAFLFLILTNQLEQVKYTLMTKLRLEKNTWPQIFQGSAFGSHPVEKTSEATETNKVVSTSESVSNSVPPIEEPFSEQNYIDAIEVQQENAQNHKKMNFQSLRHHSN